MSARKIRRLNLNEIILDIVSTMQPISSKNIWLEIGENIPFEMKPSRVAINNQLSQMLKKRVVYRIGTNDKEQFISAM